MSHKRHNSNRRKAPAGRPVFSYRDRWGEVPRDARPFPGQGRILARMTDPEVLHTDGARLGRRRGWLVLGTVLVVLVGLVVLRLGGSSPKTSPGPPQPPQVPGTTTRDAWPDDLPAGVLFLVADGRVTTTDTGTGTQTTTRVVADPVGTALTALGGGVLVWGQRGSTERVLPGGGRPAEPARGELARGTVFLPGPDGRVWAGRRERPGALTWRLVDAAGRASRRVEVELPAVSDGNGGLLQVDDRGVEPLYPRSRGSYDSGKLVATGPDGYVLRSCEDPDCRFTLHPRVGGAVSELQTAVGEDTDGGALSPANGLLAVRETVGGTTTVRVSVVATGEVKDIFPAPVRATGGPVWLDARWLALVSEDRLVLYDTADERVFTPDLPATNLGALAWQPA